MAVPDTNSENVPTHTSRSALPARDPAGGEAGTSPTNFGFTARATTSEPAPLVLVAEDDPLAATALHRGLELFGFRVLGPAHTGREAVELAADSRPDIAVLDIEMPELDGLSAAERIQNELGIPAIILSAYTAAVYLTQASRIGVSGYLVKPVKPEELAISIELSVTRFRQIQTLAERVSALEQNITDRKLIERAKGILMKSKSISEAEAYLRIQKTSRRTSRKMVDVAKSIIEAEDLL